MLFLMRGSMEKAGERPENLINTKYHNLWTVPNLHSHWVKYSPRSTAPTTENTLASHQRKKCFVIKPFISYGSSTQFINISYPMSLKQCFLILSSGIFPPTKRTVELHSLQFVLLSILNLHLERHTYSHPSNSDEILTHPQEIVVPHAPPPHQHWESLT